MIAASRRRRPGVVSADEAFRLHHRMARRATWSRRLMKGSLLTLAASLVALFAGAELVTHLVASVAAFAVGLALPVPGTERAALAEIRAAAGLSYETALGLFGSDDSVDAYGFRAAVIDRARRSVSDLRPSNPPAWWLPALAVAAALLIFGVLERPFSAGGAGSGGVTGPGGGGVSGPAAAGEEESEEARQPEVTPPEPEAGRAQEPEGAEADGRGEDPDAPAVAPPAAGGQAAAPLSRFLDSLRERPPEQGGGEPGDPQAGEAGDESQGAGAQQAGGAPGERDGESRRAEIDQGGSPAGQPSEAEGRGSQGEGEGEEGGADGQDGASEGEGGQESGEEGGNEAAGGGENEPQGGQGEAPVEEPGGDQEQSQGEFQAGGEDGNAADPLDAGGAGAGPGSEQAAGVAEGEPTAPDFLEGVLEDGPENPAGTVRLPGDREVTLPAGRSPADYQSAAEEALTEGDLPLSYQEIIRRYFR